MIPRFITSGRSSTDTFRRRLRPLLRPLNILLTISMGCLLLYQVLDIGAAEVIASLPDSAAFYAIFAAMFATLPACEVWIFRILWRLPVRQLAPAAVRRRIFSSQVLDYSGEAYAYVWAKRRTAIPGADILRTLKDNILLSSIASTLFAVVILGLLLGTGVVAFPWPGWKPSLFEAAAAVAASAGLSLLLCRRFLSLRRGEASAVFGIHALRLILVHALQLLLWVSADPGVPLESWISLLAVQIVVARIPFIPARDLLFASAGVFLAGHVEIASAVVASVLLTTVFLDRAVNLAAWFALAIPLSKLRPDSAQAPSRFPAQDLEAEKAGGGTCQVAAHP